MRFGSPVLPYACPAAFYPLSPLHRQWLALAGLALLTLLGLLFHFCESLGRLLLFPFLCQLLVLLLPGVLVCCCLRCYLADS